MTYATEASLRHSSVTERAMTLWSSVKNKLEKRSKYRRTLNELSALSTRELADLGLNRSMIHWIAHETAYGD